jgi:hypothetical protein
LRATRGADVSRSRSTERATIMRASMREKWPDADGACRS